MSDSSEPLKSAPTAAADSAFSREPADQSHSEPAPAGIRRLLRTSAPIIVTLTSRQLPAKKIVDMTLGSIIDFEQSCDQPLQLSVNNLPIAVGEAVKIGDYFGLKITAILTAEQRFEKLGGKWCF